MREPSILIHRDDPMLALFTVADLTAWRQETVRQRDRLSDQIEWQSQEIIRRSQKPYAEVIALAARRARKGVS